MTTFLTEEVKSKWAKASTLDALWNDDEPIKSRMAQWDIDAIPAWIDQNITPADVAAICQGGCDSGAYMPAVTYWQALETMGTHGDEILGYIENALGEVPAPSATTPAGQSWSGLACYYLSYAVELWAQSVVEALMDRREKVGEKNG